MQTREELYGVLKYHDYERQLDELNARLNPAQPKGRVPKGSKRRARQRGKA
jgi:hypothetical protein